MARRISGVVLKRPHEEIKLRQVRPLWPEEDVREISLEHHFPGRALGKVGLAMQQHRGVMTAAVRDQRSHSRGVLGIVTHGQSRIAEAGTAAPDMTTQAEFSI